MPLETERKFLVVDDSWREGAVGVRISQGYLTRGVGCTVRVRLAGGNAWLTIKGQTTGITRAEFEYAIPSAEARELLGLCVLPLIDKTRHEVRYGDHVWEVDVFHGANAGLVIAEVELSDESDQPLPPPWLGMEVSGDSRYFNSHLAKHPFTKWTKFEEE